MNDHEIVLIEFSAKAGHEDAVAARLADTDMREPAIACQAVDAPNRFLVVAGGGGQAADRLRAEMGGTVSELDVRSWEATDGEADLQAFAGATLLATPDFRATPGHRDEVVRMVEAKAPLFRAEPQIQGFVLVGSDEEPDRFRIVEGWTSAEEHEAYLSRPEMVAYFTDLSRLFEGENRITNWRVLSAPMPGAGA